MAWLRRQNNQSTPRSLSSQATPKNQTGCLILFGLVFGSFGMLFVVMFFLLPTWRVIEARSWVATPCTIVSSKVETSNGSDNGDTYAVAITYTYELRDPTNATAMRTYTGNRYSFQTGYSSGRDSKQTVVNANPAGSVRSCWVDPKHPERSVINRSMTSDIWITSFTLLFPLIGYGMVVGVLLGARRRRLQTGPISADAATSSSALESGSTAGELRPGFANSPVGKLIGITLICLFWNGIVSVFLFTGVIPGFQSGRPEWFLTIFLIPFVLVGVGLLVAVIYHLLALANPTLRVRLEGGPLQPSTNTQVSWELSGAATRLRRLRISLECREEATYTRGTNQTTDKHPAYQLTLLDSDEPMTMQQGRCALAIPAVGPVTFASRHNALKWFLVVHGDIPRWPDLKSEYPLTVGAPSRPLRLISAAQPSDITNAGLTIVVNPSTTNSLVGEVTWDLPTRPTTMELRLFWYTAGRGTRDVTVVENLSFPEPDARGHGTFNFDLPTIPAPYTGTLVSVLWALELVAGPGGETTRLDLMAAP